MEPTNSKVEVYDVPPFLKVYDDGTVERFLGAGFVPAGLDPETGVSSKDVVILRETGISVRIYRPNLAADHHNKLPLVIYFHGGAFCISSTGDPKYHDMLNIFVKEAQIILVSVNYRLCPETPLPAAYVDSWEALKWVSSQTYENAAWDGEIWLKEVADFNNVFIAGDSAGANITHHLAITIGLADQELRGLKINGILVAHPYFWGEEPTQVESDDPDRKLMVDNWWRFVCPSDLRSDDPLINPLVNGAPGLAGLGCERSLVCIAGKDILRERGRLYYNALVESNWKGKAEFYETEGEDHVFHIIDPKSEDSKKLFKKFAEFINYE